MSECKHDELEYVGTEMLYQRHVFRCKKCGSKIMEKDGHRE